MSPVGNSVAAFSASHPAALYSIQFVNACKTVDLDLLRRIKLFFGAKTDGIELKLLAVSETCNPEISCRTRSGRMQKVNLPELLVDGLWE